MTRRILSVLAFMAALMIGAATAAADWAVGDPYKMHYPQLPDPNGLDVNMTYPKVLADDWKCIQSGPVSDVHFWLSWLHDDITPIDRIHVSIHADVPALPSGAPSHPGDLLWSRDFGPNEFKLIYPLSGPEGWYDPNTGELIVDDHQTYGQVNIVNIPDPFLQKVGTIYWLDLSVVTPNGQVGWKTSLNHFNDDAVWGDYDPAGTDPYAGPSGWQELRYPAGIPHGGESMDLAFVITPEPGVLMLLPVALLALRRRH